MTQTPRFPGSAVLSLPRRDFLKFGAASAALLMPWEARAATPVKTKARIVIVGAGAAGLAAASRLSRMLDGASVTLIDGRKAHFYQPGFTLIAAGLVAKEYSVSATRDYLPPGATLIEEAVAEFDPEGNKVVTASGKAVPYDFLIVAAGLSLEYGEIAGMEVSAIGKDGLGSVYAGPEAAFATWKAMARFAETGGRGLFFRPATEMKCAGAPLKYTFLTDDSLRKKGNRGKAELTFAAQNKTLFSVPIVSEKVRMLFRDRGVKVAYDHVLTAIDIGRKVATFATPNGAAEIPYDFVNVVPPMRAPPGGAQKPAALAHRPLGVRGLGRGRQGDAAARPLPQRLRGGRYRRGAQGQDRGLGQMAGAGGP